MIPSHLPVVAIPPCEVRPLRASRRPSTPKMISATGNIMPGGGKVPCCWSACWTWKGSCSAYDGIDDSSEP